MRFPVPPVLAEELRAMFAEQDAERGRRGDCPKGTACTVHGGKHWHDHGLAFAQTNGGPLYGNDIRRWDFSQVVKRAKVPASDCMICATAARRSWPPMLRSRSSASIWDIPA